MMERVQRSLGSAVGHGAVLLGAVGIVCDRCLQRRPNCSAPSLLPVLPPPSLPPRPFRFPRISSLSPPPSLWPLPSALGPLSSALGPANFMLDLLTDPFKPPAHTVHPPLMGTRPRPSQKHPPLPHSSLPPFPLPFLSFARTPDPSLPPLYEGMRLSPKSTATAALRRRTLEPVSPPHATFHHWETEAEIVLTGFLTCSRRSSISFCCSQALNIRRPGVQSAEQHRATLTADRKLSWLASKIYMVDISRVAALL